MGELDPRSQLVQVLSPINLGRKDALDLLGARALHGGVIEHGGAVDDGAEGVLGVDAREELRDLRPLGYIASHDLDLGSQPVELFLELLRALRLFPRATGEEQTMSAVALNQVPCDQPARGHRWHR